MADPIAKCDRCGKENSYPFAGLLCPSGCGGTLILRSRTPTHDPVNAPAHYLKTKISAIDVIEDWGLGFCLGNAIKYISRHQHKGDPLEDLKKASWYLNREIWYLSREISRLEAEAAKGRGGDDTKGD